jgi:hypothetical protein
MAKATVKKRKVRRKPARRKLNAAAGEGKPKRRRRRGAKGNKAVTSAKAQIAKAYERLGRAVARGK